MIACIISVIVAVALAFASAMTMTVSKAQHESLKKVFSDELDVRYDNIVRERRNIYFQGLALGMAFAAIALYVFQKRIWTRLSRVAFFFAVTLATAVVYYMLYPKSDYILNHLKTPEENRAWLDMYKTMQSRYLIGLILGTLVAIPIGYVYCEPMECLVEYLG
jgi:macrodomain Ter protein organizer (MatP/YcbG family)